MLYCSSSWHYCVHSITNKRGTLSWPLVVGLSISCHQFSQDRAVRVSKLFHWSPNWTVIGRLSRSFSLFLWIRKTSCPGDGTLSLKDLLFVPTRLDFPSYSPVILGKPWRVFCFSWIIPPGFPEGPECILRLGIQCLSAIHLHSIEC